MRLDSYFVGLEGAILAFQKTHQELLINFLYPVLFVVGYVSFHYLWQAEHVPRGRTGAFSSLICRGMSIIKNGPFLLLFGDNIKAISLARISLSFLFAIFFSRFILLGNLVDSVRDESHLLSSRQVENAIVHSHNQFMTPLSTERMAFGFLAYTFTRQITNLTIVNSIIPPFAAHLCFEHPQSIADFPARQLYLEYAFILTAWNRFSLFTAINDQLELPAMDALCESFFFLIIKTCQTIARVVVMGKLAQVGGPHIIHGDVYRSASNARTNSLWHWLCSPDIALANFFSKSGMLKSFFSSPVVLPIACCSVLILWQCERKVAFELFGKTNVLVKYTAPWATLLIGLIFGHFLMRAAFNWLYTANLQHQHQSTSDPIHLGRLVAEQLYETIYPVDKLICCMIATRIYNDYCSVYLPLTTDLYWIYMPMAYTVKRFICNLYIYLPAAGIQAPYHLLTLVAIGTWLIYIKKEKGGTMPGLTQHVWIVTSTVGYFISHIYHRHKQLWTPGNIRKFIWNFYREDIEYSAWTFMAWQWAPEFQQENTHAGHGEDMAIIVQDIQKDCMVWTRMILVQSIDVYAGSATACTYDHEKRV